MARWNRSEVGQALVELAIFGSVMLAALAFVIRIGMMWNFEQQARMGGFRRALAAGFADNAPPGARHTDIHDAVGTTFDVISDRSMPDPSDGLMSMPRIRTESSAFVEWGNRLTFAHAIDEENDGRIDIGRNTQQEIVVRVNEQERSYRQDEFARDLDCGNWTLVPSNAGIVVDETITNISNGSFLETTEKGSLLSAQTVTTSDTRINALPVGMAPCAVVNARKFTATGIEDIRELFEPDEDDEERVIKSTIDRGVTEIKWD